MANYYQKYVRLYIWHNLPDCIDAIRNTLYDIFDWGVPLKITILFTTFPSTCFCTIATKSKRIRKVGHMAYMGEKRRKRDILENLGTNGRNILKWFLEKDIGKTETELTWLRIGANGVLWWMQQWTFRFRKLQGIYWLDNKPVSSKEWPCSTELIIST